MAKRKTSAAKIAHRRRNTKRKVAPKKSKEKSTSFLPSKNILSFALLLFVVGYGSTWVMKFFQSDSMSRDKEAKPSVLTTTSEPSFFEKITDRLLDRDLPHLKKARSVKTVKVAPLVKEENKAKTKTPRAPLKELKISQEQKIQTKSFSKDHMSKKDKAELDKILAKYGF